MPAEDISHPENSPLSSKGGRKDIKDKKRDKRGRDRAPSREGSLKKERSFQTPGNALTAQSVASLGTTSPVTSASSTHPCEMSPAGPGERNKPRRRDGNTDALPSVAGGGEGDRAGEGRDKGRGGSRAGSGRRGRLRRSAIQAPPLPPPGCAQAGPPAHDPLTPRQPTTRPAEEDS